jgi:hypothetical protein
MTEPLLGPPFPFPSLAADRGSSNLLQECSGLHPAVPARKVLWSQILQGTGGEGGKRNENGRQAVTEDKIECPRALPSSKKRPQGATVQMSKEESISTPPSSSSSLIPRTLLLAPTSAPASTRALRMPRCPAYAAQCSAVLPWPGPTCHIICRQHARSRKGGAGVHIHIVRTYSHSMYRGALFCGVSITHQSGFSVHACAAVNKYLDSTHAHM